MPVLLFLLILLNGGIFLGLGAWALKQARGELSPRLRTIAWLLVAVCGAYLLGTVQRLALQATRAGWLPADAFGFLLSDWQLVQSLVVAVLGLSGLYVLRRVWPHLRRSDRVVTVFTERLALDVSVSELGLTARELEILEVIAEGKLSDQEIAEAFYISPATAGTHVKNIMRKAGVRSRRDLVLLKDPEQAA